MIKSWLNGTVELKVYEYLLTWLLAIVGIFNGVYTIVGWLQ